MIVHSRFQLDVYANPPNIQKSLKISKRIFKGRKSAKDRKCEDTKGVIRQDQASTKMTFNGPRNTTEKLINE